RPGGSARHGSASPRARPRARGARRPTRRHPTCAAAPRRAADESVPGRRRGRAASRARLLEHALGPMLDGVVALDVLAERASGTAAVAADLLDERRGIV